MALNFQNSEKGGASRAIGIIAAVISVLLMTFYAMGGANGPLRTVQTAVHSLIAPFQMVGTSGGALVENASQMFGNATANPETLSELKEQNAQLTQLLIQAEEYRLENERLQGLLNLKETYDIQGVTGRVIGRSTDAWNQTVTIDLGTADGVEVGLTVLGPYGVIGQVVSATSGSATVRLLTDPQSGVSAIVQSTRAEGIVRGSLTGLLYLENVSEDSEVKVGDVVLTSGLGGSFTRGLLIGQVVQVEGKAADGTRQILIAQNESPDSFEEVVVVFSSRDANGGGGASGSNGSSSTPGDGGSTGKSGGSNETGKSGSESSGGEGAGSGGSGNSGSGGEGGN